MKYNLPKINAILIAISLIIVVIGFALMVGEPSGALEFNKDIFCAIYQMFLSDGYVNKYIIDNNYFEQLCLNLSISELEKLLNIMEFDAFTTDFIKTLINNKYYELKKILKTDFHYSDEAIEKYFKSC
jgi:hypothetical protein